MPIIISSAATATILVHRDYLRVNILTSDTTPLKYNAMFNERTKPIV